MSGHRSKEITMTHDTKFGDTMTKEKRMSSIKKGMKKPSVIGKAIEKALAKAKK